MFSTDRSVVPDIPAVTFYFLKTDLIRAFYAGALPSFAECKKLTGFYCISNQFSGAYVFQQIGVSYPTHTPPVVFCSVFEFAMSAVLHRAVD